MFVDLLERDFGPDHKVVHYIGAVSPLCATVKDTYTIAELRKEEVVKKLTNISTFYIPPRDMVDIDPLVANKLWGSEASFRAEILGSTPRWDGSKPTRQFVYGPQELKAIAEIDNHKPPEGRSILRA